MRSITTFASFMMLWVLSISPLTRANDVPQIYQADGGPAKNPIHDKNPVVDVGEDVGHPQSSHSLRQIERQMRSVQSQIRHRESWQATQKLQEQIVHDLEALIQARRRQTRESNPPPNQSPQRQPSTAQDKASQDKSSPSNSQSPARDSSQTQGQPSTDSAEMSPVKQWLNEVWGHLPERSRQQLYQWSNEQFLPKYEAQIETYFRQLAEAPETGRE